MNGGARFQGWLVFILAALVAWAFIQLAQPFSLPLWTVSLASLAGATLIVFVYTRESTSRTGPEGPLALDLSARWSLLLLAVVVILAIPPRLHQLVIRPGWDDEMWTLRNIYTSSWPELFRVAFDDYWPPLHYVLLNAVARIADTSIVSLRLPSVVAGVLSVGLMYTLGRTLFGTRVAGLFAAALLGGMTTHVMYSQEARVYSLQVLLAIISSIYFYRSHWERRISPGFLIATSLLTYSHSFASWYFVAAQATYVVVAWIIWRDNKAFVKGFLSQLFVFLLWLPLVGAFLYSRFIREIVVPTYWATAPDRLAGLADLVGLYQALAIRSWAGATSFALLSVLAILPLVRRPRTNQPDAPASGSGGGHSRAVVFVLCWIVVPVAFSWVATVGTSLDTFGEIRYHLAVLPGLCLLAAAGAAQVRTRAGHVALAALALLLPIAQLPRHYDNVLHPAMDEAARIVREYGGDDERVYVGGGFRTFAYYDRGIFPRIGSEQWDSLAAAHAGATGRYTMESVKLADTYAFEKFSTRIVYFRYYFANEPTRFPRFFADELARGGFHGPFWLVLADDGDQNFREAFAASGIECRDPVRYDVRGLELIHCGPVDPVETGTFRSPPP